MNIPTWLDEMCVQNNYLWFHITAAAVLSKIALMIGFAPWLIMISVIVVAVCWEIFYDWLFVLKYYKITDKLLRRKLFMDSVGDVIFPTIVCSLILF